VTFDPKRAEVRKLNSRKLSKISGSRLVWQSWRSCLLAASLRLTDVMSLFTSVCFVFLKEQLTKSVYICRAIKFGEYVKLTKEKLVKLLT